MATGPKNTTMHMVPGMSFGSCIQQYRTSRKLEKGLTTPFSSLGGPKISAGNWGKY